MRFLFCLIRSEFPDTKKQARGDNYLNEELWEVEVERKDTCVLSIFRWEKQSVEKQIPDKTITSSFSGSIKAVVSQEWSAHSCSFTLVVTVSSTPATLSTSLSLSLVCWFILDTSKHPSRQMRPLAATFQARIGPLYPESMWSAGWMFWMKLQKLRHKEKVKRQRADSNRGEKKKIKAPYPKVEKAFYVAVNIGKTTR